MRGELRAAELRRQDVLTAAARDRLARATGHASRATATAAETPPPQIASIWHNGSLIIGPFTMLWTSPILRWRRPGCDG